MAKEKFDLDMFHVINGNQVLTKENVQDMTYNERKNAISLVYASIHALIACNVLEGPVWDRLQEAEKAFDK